MLLSQCEARQAQLYCSDAAVSHSVKLGRNSCTAVMLLSQCEARQAQLQCTAVMLLSQCEARQAQLHCSDAAVTV